MLPVPLVVPGHEGSSVDEEPQRRLFLSVHCFVHFSRGVLCASAPVPSLSVEDGIAGVYSRFFLAPPQSRLAQCLLYGQALLPGRRREYGILSRRKLRLSHLTLHLVSM